jgi:CheY-like chemotaxis protein
VAKILVADDNSNVQKTVALALAELGVEVVSVSNGEAAVRKLGEMTPDLVLADIFMPVRNGYEVCEYVKKDSRFKHVPVVLLVGAFDPLDEREAQRVGADGILKKPFVPPDPLIAMIKSLLDRTMGDRLVAVAASKPVVAAVGKSEAVAVSDAPAPQISEEPAEEEPLRPINSAAFDDGDRPVAFGQLLDTPERDSGAAATEQLEPVDDEQILTSQRDATLGDPIFWRNDSPEAEAEAAPEAQEETAGLDIHSWGTAESSLSRREESALLQPIEPLELVRDGQEDAPGSVVETGSILLDQASQASLTVQPGKAEELAANPIEWMATAPPPPAELAMEPAPGWEEPILETQDSIELEPAAPPEFLSPSAIVPEPDTEKAAVPAPEPVVVPAQAEQSVAVKIPEREIAPEANKTQPSIPAAVTQAATQALLEKTAPKQSVEDTARSIPKHDWEDLAAMLHASHSAADAELDAAEEAARAAAKPAANGAATSKIAPEASAAPTAPRTGAELIAPVLAKPAAEPDPAKNMLAAPVAPSTPLVAVKPSAPDPALVEAVVQKVLDKMRPQVVEIITKEFLRPIVEALVQREIKKQ